MSRAREIPIGPTGEWESLPEWPELYRIIDGTVAGNSARHPGIITEAIIETVTGSFDLEPRETMYRERRTDHPERIRRLSHAVFRILDADAGSDSVRQITGAVLKAFILSPLGENPVPEGEESG